jgi:hypothetical protein
MCLPRTGLAAIGAMITAAWPAASRQPLYALDDGRGGHGTAAAHGDQRGARVAPLQLVQRGESTPPRLPIGVRAASTITASPAAAPLQN